MRGGGTLESFPAPWKLPDAPSSADASLLRVGMSLSCSISSEGRGEMTIVPLILCVLDLLEMAEAGLGWKCRVEGSFADERVFKGRGQITFTGRLFPFGDTSSWQIV